MERDVINTLIPFEEFLLIAAGLLVNIDYMTTYDEEFAPRELGSNQRK